MQLRPTKHQWVKTDPGQVGGRFDSHTWINVAKQSEAYWKIKTQQFLQPFKIPKFPNLGMVSIIEKTIFI